ncbi:SDR family oxidoreductase [Catenisphaera adipataccumulans]|jgi:dTDP-4-dehydrorhamnose reductase|uniref:dTDP-4-dehydrorhamnose reductase n=1 Tax=Catenisphaera adipataccumulans TaxID=700500 RepID=A0A7W8FU65_9FIRM|nr:sugar nucleotide-binding protein [Catenisphaera adipataccumulans]MBB5182274.1 dTDP-4-dehydrorhamnose reductase [Catenisphaera adipataccumulans]
MKTILTTGSNGYLASLIYQTNRDPYHWIRMTRKNADLTDPDAVEAYLRTQDFDVCFHAAANANTKFCDEHPDLAKAINVESTKRIVNVCKEKGAKLIFSGSEQEFNGVDAAGPHTESETTKSVTMYGQNKIECEQYIQDTYPQAVLLRYSWQMGLSMPGIKASPNLMKNVMTALLHQQPTLFTCNEKRCMTYAKHLAEAFPQLIELEPGIYHVAASNERTTYECAVYIAQQLGASPEAIKQFILPNHERYADRFRDFRLDAGKLAAKGITFGTFEENVQEILKDFGWDK